MGFLKKLGQIVLKVTAGVAGFAPMVQQLIPNSAGVIQTVSHDLAQIADVIATVEVMGQALNQQGADKLKAATPLVAQIILKSSLLARHEIDNPVLFAQGCQKIADGMADVLNSLKENVETVPHG